MPRMGRPIYPAHPQRLWWRVTNTKSQVIWVRKGDNLLCLLGDQTPSILPDVNAVAASLKTLPELGCFTRL